MALNNAIVRNKTIIQEILSADPQFILDKVIEKGLITHREYTKLNSINKGDAEDLVIKLVDKLINKGRQTEFIGLLQDEEVLETYPKLKDVEWEDSGSTASSSSLSIGHGDNKTVVEPRKKTRGNRGWKRKRSESEEEVTNTKPCTVDGSGSNTETRSAGQALSEKQLLKVAQTLGQEWDQTALHLGLETKDLEDIKAEHRSVAMQKQKMLVLWKRRRPGEATAKDLLEGLKDLEDLPDETRLLLEGQNMSDTQLLEVAQTLGQEWEQAALHLGLETKDLEDIKAEHRSEAMQKQKMLVLWKRRRLPGEATAHDLLRGLKDLEDLPVETRQLLRGQNLSDKQLLEVAQTLGQKWQQAVVHLELKTKDLDDIKAKHRSVVMQKLRMLVLWKRQRPPGKATAQDLLRGLEDMEDLPDNTPLSLSGELQRIRSEFVNRVSNKVIKGLLDDLWQQHVFSTEEKDYMMEDFRTRARCLIDRVTAKGERASLIMIDSMKKRDPDLCSTLGLISSPAGVGHWDDKTLVKPKEPTFFSRARDNKTRSAGRNLSNKQLMKVAEMLGQEWEQAAIHLELSITDLDCIQADRQTDVAMQKYKMLVQWKRQRPPGEATAQDLLKGLEDMKDIPFETRLLLTDYWTGEELPNLLERFLNQFQRSNENESHAVSSTKTLSSSETNTPESAPQLPQATNEDEEDTPYPMKAQPKGYCLIVNNFDFSRSGLAQSQRMVTEIDEESLRRVFTWLGFKVQVLRDATRDQMLSSMRELARRDHSGMDCVVCVVLSHGLEGGVYGVDGGVVRLKELTDVLNGVRCASLRGKPKLFFIQACQGNQNEQAVPVLDNRPARPEVRDQTDGPSSTGDHTQTDGPSSTGDLCSDAVEESEWVPTSADFLTAMATTPSYTSMRVDGRGSWFIQSLCHNLVKLVPRGQDLTSILMTVHNDVSIKYNRNDGRRQMSQPHTSLRTRLVFPVPEGPLPRLPTSPYTLRDQVSPTETKGRTSELLLSSEQFKTEKLKDRDNIYTIMAPANRTRMALLITNMHFKHLSDRHGAEKDEQDMSKLLISLGYNVEQHRDLSGAEMDEAVKRFSKDPRLATTDSVFVVIRSHGVRGAILGVHHDQFPIDNIFKHLDSAHCPNLLNKPKVIIIQACRGDKDGSAIVCDGPGSVPEQAPVVQVDAALPPHLADEVDADVEEDAIRMVHKEKDMVSLLSCTADTRSYTHKIQGSFLIQHLVEIFNRHAHEDHIDELFRKVLKRFEDEPPSASVRQMAVKDRCTLTRKLYLFPGL
ncbi:uncharacterized protein LOC130405758 isoform X1 [Gadus chalcogrammus]|uniref:uncharacterized protein LOC130405758 isoform X1 n=1 Tax=Gadus chalcogrammus TaxID=1042646 RepID=UPI0024C4A5C6|nr:uncharacterized protein LOC130405758 isoform X1 [Gadus chalcogrammus]